MDDTTKQVLIYLNKNVFALNHVLTCTADIARAIQKNPRTVQSRINKLISAKVIQIVDCYPRNSKPIVFVYLVNRPKLSEIVHQPI